MNFNRYCEKCGHKRTYYIDVCTPCDYPHAPWCRDEIFLDMIDNGITVIYPDIQFPRSPCDNGSCDNSNNGCVLIGICHESRGGKRELTPDEMAWNLNRDFFQEENEIPGGYY